MTQVMLQIISSSTVGNDVPAAFLGRTAYRDWGSIEAKRSYSHADVVAHSTPYLPIRNSAEFLELVKALAAPTPADGDKSAVGKVSRCLSCRSRNRASPQAYTD